MFRGVPAVQSRGQSPSDLVPFEANTVWWWCGFSGVSSRGCWLVEVAVMQSVSLDRVSVDATNACKRWEEKAGPG